MSKEQFVSELADAIERAVMQAQGMMDYLPQASPQEIAEWAADAVSELAWIPR
jgi:hypothetical protein